jgi:hypothetical protein
MYKDIAKFLKESPKWVESWLASPVKAKYIQNPLLLPELVAYTFQFLDLYGLKKCLAINSTWRSIVNTELHRRQRLLVRKYWDIIVKIERAQKEWNYAFDNLNTRTSPETKQLYKKFDELVDEKEQIFTDQVEVERFILFYGFADENEAEKINSYIICHGHGMDPVEVGWTENYEIIYHGYNDSDPLDYWGDKDPDV